MPTFRRKSAVSYDRSRSVAQNLIGYWPFAEGGGLLARDVVGRAGHLVLTAPVWGQGPWGADVTYDGSSTKAVLADNSNLEIPSTQVTLVTAWTVTANPTDQTPYAGKRVGYQNYSFGIQSRVFNSFTDTQGWLNVGGTSYTTPNGFNSLSLNTPYILALRWRSGDYMNVRVFDRNGNVVYDQNSTTTITGSLSYDSGPFFVGYHENSDTTGPLYMPGRSAFTLLSARAWSDNELRQFVESPILTPRKRRALGSISSNALAGTVAATSSVTGSVGGATSYSTVTAGSWATSTNWSPAGVPANGDTVTINHAITVSANTTIGSSGVNGTYAVVVNAAGSLTLASASTLVSRGDIVLNNATLTMGAGTTLEMDSSASATPSATHYAIKIGQAHNQSSARLVVNGVNGSRCIIRSNSGGGNGYITDSGFLNGGLITGTYVLFTRMGDSVNDNLFSANSGGTFSLTNSSLDTCGRFTSTYNNSSDGSVTFQSCVWKNSLGSECLRILGNSPGSYGSGTRLIDDCTFDKVVAFYTPEHYTVTNNQFYASYDVLDAAWYLFDGNFDYKTTTSESPIPASVSNNYRIIDGALTNPHFVQFRAYARNMTIDGDVFEFTGTDGQGDCILTPSTNPASPQTYSATRCIMLKNGGSDDSGTPFTFFGSQPNVSLNFHHNTFYMGSQGAAVGETGSGYANTLTFRDNIGWDDAGIPRGFLLYDSGTNDSVTDLVPASLADYNNTFNGRTGSNGKGYDSLEFSSGSPGAHDLAVDPQYVNPACRIATWDASLGGPGTVANAIAELKKKNDPSQSYNSNYTIAALLAYVKAGFVPRNQSLKNADHTGSGDVGAVTVASTSTSMIGTVGAAATLTGAIVAAWYAKANVAARAVVIGNGTVPVVVTRSNFLMATADIPLRSKLITPSLEYDEDYDVRNLFIGERERIAQLLTASTTQTEIVFTLGAGNARAAEFLYLAQGAMLLENGVTSAYLQGSNDGSTWTSIIGRSTSLSGAVPYGQDLRDLMFTPALNDTIAGATTSRFIYWKLILGGGTSKRPFSKAFFGQWLDMGEPNECSWEPLNAAADAWLYPRGNELMAKTATEHLKFSVEWTLVTDAKAAEFEQSLLLNSYQHRVVLYTQTDHSQLAGRRIAHCKVVDEECEITPVLNDITGITLNTVKAVFEELS